MITLLILSAFLVTACAITIRRCPRQWVRDLAAMLAYGFLGIFIVAVCGLLFEPPQTWAFPLVFAFGAGIEQGHIRRRRAAEERQQQLDALFRDLGWRR